MFELHEIGERLRTQDNRITDAPIFIVQQRRRIYGLDSRWSENFIWMYDHEEVEPTLAVSLEAGWAAERLTPTGYDRVGYVHTWEFVTACFTEAACELYIKQNAHNLKEPRVYADGSYRNWEWQTVRDHLMATTNDAEEVPA